MSKFVITQGEFKTSADPDTTISTLLGSCVACCLWDPIAAVGGMNHILQLRFVEQRRHGHGRIALAFGTPLLETER